ncbi:MAG: hypothetical protein EOO77_39110 [Oxalobacteraceae bacterium]|nr:MAG: hypothetical protein EOO77_39110 [Oxalobacteraceae bacterium]
MDEKFTLAPIEGKIVEFVKFVKSACNGTGKENGLARDRAKFLVRDLMELKKEKSLPSRVSAVELLYKNFGDCVKDLPEESEEAEGLKNGAHPKKVIVKGMIKCPKGCDEDQHAKLIKLLKNPKSFTYTKSDRSWTPDLGKQTGHADGKNWKAYVDAETGSGTKWRMGFSMAFEEVDEELTVDINYCKIGH